MKEKQEGTEGITCIKTQKGETRGEGLGAVTVKLLEWALAILRLGQLSLDIGFGH